MTPKNTILINLSFIQSCNINQNNVLKLRTFYFELELLQVTSARKQLLKKVSSEGQVKKFFTS